MAKEEIMERMTFILYGDNLQRVSITQDEDGMVVITVDVHQMKVAQVKKLIRSIVSMYRFTFRLVIIHGYNHGTAIKDMIANQCIHYRILKKVVAPYNPGMTTLSVIGTISSCTA